MFDLEYICSWVYTVDWTWAVVSHFSINDWTFPFLNSTSFAKNKRYPAHKAKHHDTWWKSDVREGCTILWQNAKTLTLTDKRKRYKLTHSHLQIDLVLQSVLYISLQTQPTKINKCCWGPNSSDYTDESSQEEEVLQAANHCATCANALLLYKEEYRKCFLCEKN